jgi:hypothetical protein
MTGYRIDDAPHLPVGTGSKLTVPKFTRSEEPYEDSSNIAAGQDNPGPRC